MRIQLLELYLVWLADIWLTSVLALVVWLLLKDLGVLQLGFLGRRWLFAVLDGVLDYGLGGVWGRILDGVLDGILGGVLDGVLGGGPGGGRGSGRGGGPGSILDGVLVAYLDVVAERSLPQRREDA